MISRIFAFTWIVSLCSGLLTNEGVCQSMKFNDQRHANFFDKDYARYEQYFDTIDAGERSELEELLAKLENRLKPLSAEARELQEVKDRYAKIEALRAKLGGGSPAQPAAAAPAAAAPATPAAAPAKSDSQIAREFQTDYNDVFNTVRRTRGADLVDEAKVAAIYDKLGKLEGHIAALSDQNGSLAKQMQGNHESLRTSFDAAVAKAKEQHAAATAPKPATEPAKPAVGAAAPVSADQAKPLGFSDKRNLDLFDKDLERHRQDFDAPTAENYAFLQKALGTLERRLAPIGLHARSHPDVKQRIDTLTALRQKLNVAFPDGAPKTAAAAPDVKPLDAVSAKTVGAFDKDLNRYEPMFERAHVSDMLTIRECLAKLNSHLGRIGFHVQQHPEVQARRELLAEWQKKIDAAFGDLRPFTEEEQKLVAQFRAQFNKLSYELGTHLNPISLQDPAVRKRAETTLAELRAPLEACGNKNHPDFLAEKIRLDEMQGRFDAAIADSASKEAAAGDVDAQLDMIQRQFPQKGFNPEIDENASPEQVEEWARQLRGWLSAVDEAVKFFRHAESTSIKARSPEFQQYSYWFERNVKSSINAAIASATRTFESPIHQGLHPAMSEANSLDPDRVALNLQWVNAGLDGANRLLAFKRGFEGTEDEDLARKIETMHKLIAEIQGGAEEAIKNNRMPEPRSTDPLLLTIAKQKLAEDKEYDFGQIENIIVNYDVHEKEDVRYHDGYFYFYKWKEFQVTFAEKDGDDWWVRTAMFKNYSRGSDCTKNVWQIVRSHRWSKILEENIYK